MDENALRVRIKEHLDLIKYDSKGLSQAPERATAFLIMVAILADEKRACEEDRAKLTTLSSTTYAQAMGRCSKSKQVTEKKAEAEMDESYTSMREGLEECEAKIGWLRTYIEVFNNAHICYRNFAKE